MSHTFAFLAREHFGENFDVRHIAIEVLRRRNQRCVIRYRVEILEAVTRQREEWRVIGKVYKAKRGERVFETMQQLWQNGFARDAEDGISIPEPLYFSSPLCMLFQEEVPGVPVKTLVKAEQNSSHFRRLARVIAKLHRCELVPDQPFLVKDHLLRCHPRYPFLELACPELEHKIEYIVQTAQKIEAALVRDAKLTPIHGDFHLGQIHLDNGNAWLIDFDALGYGDPASDLGNVLVFLRGKVKKHPGVVSLINAFLDEYFAVMDRDIANRILLYEGLTHLRRACKCLRLQEEGWRRRVSRMVDDGVACIEEMRSNGWTAERYLFGLNGDEDFQEAEEEVEAACLKPAANCKPLVIET
jgi:Ser/Thr protein kinase RdoA (MazF antagonist)